MRLAAITTLCLAALATAAAPSSGAVHLRGTAYEFNNVGRRLAGAQIRVAEDPRLGTVARRDGTYDLAVPDHARITPYIVAAGYHTIYLQAFDTDGENLDRVNFQTPTDPVFRALAALLEVPLAPDGQLRECAIVSTFNTRAVRDLSFDAFTAFGAHGVAGATASASPALTSPTYFNAQVVPDPAQRRSSVDGGVIWTQVPAGVYAISATHRATRFASFTATCEPGRIVNANPPWGLHELGLPNHAHVAASWSVRGSRVTLRRLDVGSRPPAALVYVFCRGHGCPFAARTLRHQTFAARGLRAGQTISVLVSAHNHDARLVRWRLRPSHPPLAQTLCVPLGNTKPRSRC